jgi:hypothetical protein
MNKYRVIIYCGEAVIPYDVVNYIMNKRWVTLYFDDNSIKYFMLADDVDYIDVVPINN